MKIILDGTLEIEGDSATPSHGGIDAGEFEREGGKIKRRSQHNIVQAIRQFGFRFETDKTLPGEIRIRRPDDSIFYSNEGTALKKVWLEIERQFGFLPAWAFFQTVFLDYADRNTVENNMKLDFD
jgi:hypothetical protein